jgi:hypothetical protein
MPARTRQPVADFVPPTAAQVADHLNAHPPTGPSLGSRWGATAVLFTGVVLMVTVWPMTVVFAIVVVLLFSFGSTLWRRRHLATLERRTSLVGELAVLRQYARCLRLAWRLLPRTVAHPPLHGRVVAAMAHALDALNCPEAAAAVYDHILARMPAEHPHTVLFKLQRAIAELRCDQLFDADETLRRLRGTIEALNQPPVNALHRLALLTQQVKTGHYADGIEHSPRLLRELRPLGVEAGFGYALMAVCFYHLIDKPQQPRARVLCERWWTRAALLLPTAALVGRIPEARALLAPTPALALDPGPPEAAGDD